MGILSEAQNIIAGNRYIITTTRNGSLILKSMAQLLYLHDQIENLNSVKADAVRADIAELIKMAYDTLGTEMNWAPEDEKTATATAAPTAEVHAQDTWFETVRDNPLTVFATVGVVWATWALATTVW